MIKMTKNEFMKTLTDELLKRNVADAADVAEEYEQHFAFKLAGGYSEEEIASRLGDPVTLAAQFGEPDHAGQQGKNKPFVFVGLCFADLFAALLFIFLAAWELVMIVAGISFAGLAVCLFGNLNIWNLIPAMPYPCGFVLALSLTALTVLVGIGCIYYGAFLRQLLRAFGRFQHNALASVSDKASLPPLAVNPQFSARTKRVLRSAALLSTVCFAVCFVLSYVISALSAGSFEFWHTWNWLLN